MMGRDFGQSTYSFCFVLPQSSKNMELDCLPLTSLRSLSLPLSVSHSFQVDHYKNKQADETKLDMFLVDYDREGIRSCG